MNKFHKILICLTAAMTAAVLIFPDNRNRIPESAKVQAETEAQRTEYFASHGWEVQELCSRSVVIPKDFSSSYEEYALMQDKQGMPLREYAGEKAEIFLYEVKNYSPDSKKMLAELLVCDNTAIASMVYSEDGGTLRSAVS